MEEMRGVIEASRGELGVEIDGMRGELAASTDLLKTSHQDLDTARKDLQAARDEVTHANKELWIARNELKAVQNDMHSMRSQIHKFHTDVELFRSHHDKVTLELNTMAVALKETFKAEWRDDLQRLKESLERRINEGGASRVIRGPEYHFRGPESHKLSKGPDREVSIPEVAMEGDEGQIRIGSRVMEDMNDIDQFSISAPGSKLAGLSSGSGGDQTGELSTVRSSTASDEGSAKDMKTVNAPAHPSLQKSSSKRKSADNLRICRSPRDNCDLPAFSCITR